MSEARPGVNSSVASFSSFVGLGDLKQLKDSSYGTLGVRLDPDLVGRFSVALYLSQLLGLLYFFALLNQRIFRWAMHRYVYLCLC